MNDVVIIGGGLAGLVSAIQLAGAGIKTLVIEKKAYPFHKVCGEYLSNEVRPFLQQLGAYPEKMELPRISRFMLSSNTGRPVYMELGLGGVGISRYSLDHFLCQVAKQNGAEFRLNTKVESVTFNREVFEVALQHGEKLTSKIVIGAYGKRSGLDRQIDRKFMRERSPYIGIKYHINYDFPSDLIALHNFPGGYCGVCSIEGNKQNLCYLGSRTDMRKWGNVHNMEKEVLCQNPYLKKIFSQAEFLFEKPEVINEVSFSPKKPVVNHILMAGDAAGMIAPLCGNGMAMAIHSAKILSELIVQYYKKDNWDRSKLELAYSKTWNKLFAKRMKIGRVVQKLFGTWASQLMVSTAKNIKPFANYLIGKTHGKPFL